MNATLGREAAAQAVSLQRELLVLVVVLIVISACFLGACLCTLIVGACILLAGTTETTKRLVDIASGRADERHRPTRDVRAAEYESDSD
jgi:hypothetical protein